MTTESAALITLVLGAITTLVGATWKLLKAREEAELAWSERAQSLWKQMEILDGEVDALRRRVAIAEDAARHSGILVQRLRDEVHRLRLAIRSATDLEALKRQEERIPSTEEFVEAQKAEAVTA